MAPSLRSLYVLQTKQTFAILVLTRSLTLCLVHHPQEMVRCGATCFNDMYFFPEATAAVADEIGMRATVGAPILEFPNNWATSTECVDEALSKARELVHQYRDHPLIRVTVAPHTPYTGIVWNALMRPPLSAQHTETLSLSLSLSLSVQFLRIPIGTKSFRSPKVRPIPSIGRDCHCLRDSPAFLWLCRTQHIDPHTPP
jgi:hypothetical protein